MHVDVLIVGAGISGIDAAYHVQTSCPSMSYAILEARHTLGGTWDLFRYPGVRSDSDMYTLGFPFRPWCGDKSLADGPSILAYLRETAEAYGIDRHIHYNQRVEHARWSSESARWTLGVRDTTTGELREVTCSFLFVCAGYYDYERGYTPELAGRTRFGGQLVHPQHWPEDLDYTGKRVVVIGSGATAVTLVPELAKRAAHVTMLQRSPTYIVSVPARDPIARWLHRRLPDATAAQLARWKNVLVSMALYTYSRRFPAHASKWLIGQVRKQTAGTVDVAIHFTPQYKPWDQRLCLVPDADLFEAIKAGTVSVVTDHIATLTETGIALRSGGHLDADIIVTATGLVLKLFGGIALDVDGQRVDPARCFVYKGMMLSGVPNFAFAVGYTNASWTLKCDLTSQFVCRLINHMRAHGYTRAVPRPGPSIGEAPLIDFTSGYVQRVRDQLPKQGTVVPWKLHQNYIRDLVLIRRSPIEEPSLELSPAATRARG